MARTLDEMKAARAALLLRCQRAREAARRVDVARAEQSHAAALEGERRARGALDTGKTQASKEIAGVGQALRAEAIDRRRLDALLGSERAALTNVAILARDVERARTEISEADRHREAARAALLTERRATRKRERLADETATAWARTLDRIEETEREDAFADAWRPA